jgi:hypothetical protein
LTDDKDLGVSSLPKSIKKKRKEHYNSYDKKLIKWASSGNFNQTASDVRSRHVGELDNVDNYDMLLEGDGAIIKQRGRSEKRRKKDDAASEKTDMDTPTLMLPVLYKGDKSNAMAAASSTDASGIVDLTSSGDDERDDDKHKVTMPATKCLKWGDMIEPDCKSPQTHSKQSTPTRYTYNAANVVTPEIHQKETPYKMIALMAITSIARRSLSVCSENDSTLSYMEVESEYHDTTTARKMTYTDIFKIKSSFEDFKFLTVELHKWSLYNDEPGATMGHKDECVGVMDPNWTAEHHLKFAKWVRTAFGRELQFMMIAPC